MRHFQGVLWAESLSTPGDPWWQLSFSLSFCTLLSAEIENWSQGQICFWLLGFPGHGFWQLRLLLPASHGNRHILCASSMSTSIGHTEEQRGWGDWGKGTLPSQVAQPGTCGGSKAGSAHCPSKRGRLPSHRPRCRGPEGPLSHPQQGQRPGDAPLFWGGGDLAIALAMSIGSPARLRSHPPVMEAASQPLPQRERAEEAGGPPTSGRKRKKGLLSGGGWKRGEPRGPELWPLAHHGTDDDLAVTASPLV